MKNFLSSLALAASLTFAIGSAEATPEYNAVPSYDITIKNNTTAPMSVNQWFDWGQWTSNDGPLNMERTISPGQIYTYHVYNEAQQDSSWSGQTFGFSITAPLNIEISKFWRSEFYIGIDAHTSADSVYFARNYTIRSYAGCVGQNDCKMTTYQKCKVYNNAASDDSFSADCSESEIHWFTNKYTMIYDYQIVNGKPKLFIYRQTNGGQDEWLGEANVEDLKGYEYNLFAPSTTQAK